MSQYNVVTVFDLDGVMQPVGSVVELSDEAAAPLLEQGVVSLVVEETAPESTGEGEAKAE